MIPLLLHAPALAMIGSPVWLYHFHPYGLFHLVTLGVCLVVIVAWCAVGRWLLVGDRRSATARAEARGSEKPRSCARERRLRVTLGWVFLAWQIFATGWRLLPENYDLQQSWPLHVCRVMGFVAPIALITHWRRPRALLFFWGIGLSTQAFISPMWDYGVAEMSFWLYWVGHTQIIGAAVYEVVVHGYGPRVREWGFAAVQGFVFAGVLIPLNLLLGTNYNYLGRGGYEAASIVDWFGPFPQRAWWIVGGGQIAILLLYWCALTVRIIKRKRAWPGVSCEPR